jgi:hypothetical protein
MEETRVRNVQIIDPVSFAVEIKNRLFGVGSELQRAGLMRGAPDQHVLA